MTTPTKGEHAQPEALRLADALASNYFDGKQGRDVWDAAAAELRRLHAQVAALTAAPQGGAYAELPAIDWSQAGLLMEAHATTREFVTGTTNWAAAICRYMTERASRGQAQQPAPSAAGAVENPARIAELLRILQSNMGPRRPEAKHPEDRQLWDWVDATCEALTSPTPQADSQPAKVSLFNPLEGGNPETALQMAAVIALRDSQPAPDTDYGRPAGSTPASVDEPGTQGPASHLMDELLDALSQHDDPCEDLADAVQRVRAMRSEVERLARAESILVDAMADRAARAPADSVTAPAGGAVAGPGGKCMGPRCMACVENGYAHSRECIDEAGETQGWKPTAEDYAKCGPSAAAPTPAAQGDASGKPHIVRLAEDFAEDCIRAGYVTTNADSHRRLMDAARARPAPAASVLEDAARWRDHAGKLDALVAYCPTCCQGFIAKQDMTRDEVLFACGKAVGQSGAKRLREALDLAVGHIDMDALRISHCKDAAAIDAARKQGANHD